ncbi:MAG: hypothetical protein IJ081_03285 [Prevotella sp.]|nr:hypothetical protein [Prevotella sp.]
MKKIYMKPVVECVNIKLSHVIAGSLSGMGSGGGDIETSETQLGSGIDAESRGSFWDDEE